jgi:hypothetical protein
MGVNSGLVYRIEDVNENLNISGGGINIAQRVMDCGDAGHILLSKRVADDLGQLSRWKKDLHDLGEAVVKHGDRVHIYNLYNDEIGNAEVPAKLRVSVAKPRPINRWLVVGAALLLVAIVAVAVFFGLKPQRSLAYSLTVQKMSGGQKVGGEIESTGRELYGNGWKFRINVTPAQPGSLYIIDEGPVNFNVLFPTPANNNGVAQLAANQTLHTGWYDFDENPGTEKVWIIWSAQPIGELDTIFKEAGQHKLEIHDSQQIKIVRDLITRYGNTEAAVDNSRKQATVTGRGNVVISLFALDHNQY